MTPTEFHEGMKRLDDRFKKTTDSLKESYFEEVKHIPSLAFNDIISALVRAFRGSYPIPQDILDHWAEWRRLNPRMVAQETQPEECSQCYGTGELVFDQYVEHLGMWYLIHCACGYCRNWQNHWPTKGPNVPRRFKWEEILGNPNHRRPLEHVPGYAGPQVAEVGSGEPFDVKNSPVTKKMPAAGMTDDEVNSRQNELRDQAEGVL